MVGSGDRQVGVAFDLLWFMMWQSSRSSPLVVEVDRIIDRSIRDSHALDTEALCIIAGEKVSPNKRVASSSSCLARGLKWICLCLGGVVVRCGLCVVIYTFWMIRVT